MKHIRLFENFLLETPILFHGHNNVDDFDLKNIEVKLLKNNGRFGLFTTTNYHTAKCFGKKISIFKKKYTKPFIVDAEEANYNQIPIPDIFRDEYLTETTDIDELAISVYERGYDILIVKNVFEGNGNTQFSDVYVLFDSNNITTYRYYTKHDNLIGKKVKCGMFIETISKQDDTYLYDADGKPCINIDDAIKNYLVYYE